MAEWHKRIAVDPDVLGGKPVIKGTRISVEMIMGLLAHGYSIQQILEQYEHIDREDIKACLTSVFQAERG